jgi:hypothetical protein
VKKALVMEKNTSDRGKRMTDSWYITTDESAHTKLEKVRNV